MKNLLTICFCWFALSVWGQQDTTFLYMDSLFQQLPEVLVRGERPVIKAEKGKLIYDVPRIIEKLPVTNAYEVLKELPGVTEQNGTLSLGGLRVSAPDCHAPLYNYPHTALWVVYSNSQDKNDYC